MGSIAFFDVEVSEGRKKVFDIGCVKDNGDIFHSSSAADFTEYIKGTVYACGHNIFKHDLNYIGSALSTAGIDDSHCIDTLYLSPLLFPAKPYHYLVKDDKLRSEDINNPVNDSKSARNLFYDEVSAYRRLDTGFKDIIYHLLHEAKEFTAFFDHISYTPKSVNTVLSLIKENFGQQICVNRNLEKYIIEHPVELAYCLSLIKSNDRYSITPPWVFKNFPATERLMSGLRNEPCTEPCDYCRIALDIKGGLNRYFGFEGFRTFNGVPLQEDAIRAAVSGKSLLAVFPTGGGKSLTFQLPALMGGENAKGLTVVISPLQSLMKDQVDNLEKVQITEAVTINGLLDPIERATALSRVEDGSASILYISPESLRSRTIEHVLTRRTILRFVIDEAHCFSAWGHDFRVDYLYIGEFIKLIMKKKNSGYKIPVSCFTATAKPDVIEDIRKYLWNKLSLELELFTTDAKRVNLYYSVLEKPDEPAKYEAVRDLITEKKCPVIIYVSRTKRAYELASRLTRDGYPAMPYHGRMDNDEKSRNQDLFISGEVDIMVATSAFGMGVDKKDVGMVIHYDISDSLENYIQEAGRAGRDEAINADCYVLYNEDDLNKHFILLNQTKLNVKEIQQIWKAIKDITRDRTLVSQSALEIARKAGWMESIDDIETRVRSAVAALEEAGYVKRGQNVPKIYADSILSKSMKETSEKIKDSSILNDHQKKNASRIMSMLFSIKSRKEAAGEDAESRVDYISDRLGIKKEDVIAIINSLKEERILADMKDLSAFIKPRSGPHNALGILSSYMKLERFLLFVIKPDETAYHIKALNEAATENGCDDSSINRIITIVNFWAIKNLIKRKYSLNSKNHIELSYLYPKNRFEEHMTKRYELAGFILEYLYLNAIDKNKKTDPGDEQRVEFSVLELKEAYESRIALLNSDITAKDVEDALFYLSRIGALKIEGGFMVLYNALSIERTDDLKKKYTLAQYKKLLTFYENKIQQIHIVGEYAKKMLRDYDDAIQFTNDYFGMQYDSFLKKYFNSQQRRQMKRNLSPGKFMQIFGGLSPTQLAIINDKSRFIAVAAGPGSGKTRVLVHKLASLVLMEDIRSEQLLMLTFSRAAAFEFKSRLKDIIGNAVYYIDIKTFHSFCFDVLGKLGSLDKSDEIIKRALEVIGSGDAEPSKITRMVMVIDEAQDMDHSEYELIKLLIAINDGIRVIAVGDDDQNIYEFRGSSSRHLHDMINSNNAQVHELVHNYRSKSNLVDLTNQFAATLDSRLKTTPIISVQKDNGNIRIIRYKSTNLVTPFVADIVSTVQSGTTGILTKTNEEAAQVTGLLVNEGIRAKLIQSNEGFSLFNLYEVREFISILKNNEASIKISPGCWITSVHEFSRIFGQSRNYSLLSLMIDRFDAEYPVHKYMSDFEIFIKESSPEDFTAFSSGILNVSTMHKAKGHEFDNVFVMLDNYSIESDESKRLLYVAMTRAKTNLTIHYNGHYLDHLTAEDKIILTDPDVYKPPLILAMQLSHKDVWLDWFKHSQKGINSLSCGDELLPEGFSLFDVRGNEIIRFSKQFISQLEVKKQFGYELKRASVMFIVYWLKEDETEEIKIVLPEVYFEKDE